MSGVYFSADHVRAEVPGIRLLGSARNNPENDTVMFLAEAYGPPIEGKELVSYWEIIPRGNLEFGVYEQMIHDKWVKSRKWK